MFIKYDTKTKVILLEIFTTYTVFFSHLFKDDGLRKARLEKYKSNYSYAKIDFVTFCFFFLFYSDNFNCKSSEKRCFITKTSKLNLIDSRYANSIPTITTTTSKNIKKKLSTFYYFY